MEGTPEGSDESARALWTRFRTSHDPALRGRLIERYLPLARYAASRYYRMRADESVPFEDYLQYARIGLVEAIDDYDPGREASFATYSSYRIRGALLNGLGRESEIAAQRSFWRTRLHPEAGVGAQPPQTPLFSFPLAQACDDAIDDDVHANPHQAVEQVELLALIGDALEKLPMRERELIRRYYFEHCELRVIAHELSVTPGRVSQLHSKALLRIRELLAAKDAAVVLDGEQAGGERCGGELA